MQQFSRSKPQQFVYGNRPRIVLPDVEEGRLATRTNAIDDLAHQQPSVTFSGMFRMRAHSTDLGKARHFEALTCHSYESSAITNTKVGSEFVSASAERSGLGECRQFQHLRGC